ncbi:formate transporter [Salmonella enterica subsp. enterica serovar Adelaide str. A4-669]|uniref:Formate transporter n=1 Tax=Salmonella enterica subsp. enterica serovar Adelaide str. A4-669 TaxID=913063 RepID=A0A6C8GQD3_SALET|nr:formate transporter [Salmonella enterica subsp. enterica serovar Adelaide str. A4-669]
MHKSHATYGPISQARYDLYQILIYNALLVSRRRLSGRMLVSRRRLSSSPT